MSRNLMAMFVDGLGLVWVVFGRPARDEKRRLDTVLLQELEYSGDSHSRKLPFRQTYWEMWSFSHLRTLGVKIKR